MWTTTAGGWKHTTLKEIEGYLKRSGSNWSQFARRLGKTKSTVHAWKTRAPSEENQLQIKALISSKAPPHKTPEQILSESGTAKKKVAKKITKVASRKDSAEPGLKATSRATFSTPVEIKSKRYERKGSEGAWQVTRLSPKVTAKRMQEALAQTQVIVSTWHDLPPQKTPAALVSKDMKAIEGAFSLAGPALKTVREVTTAYIAAHGSKADPKVVAWLTAEILSLVFGERR